MCYLVFLVALIPRLVSAANAAEGQSSIFMLVGVIIAGCCACLCLIDSAWARDPEVSTDTVIAGADRHAYRLLHFPSANDPDVGNQPGKCDLMCT